MDHETRHTYDLNLTVTDKLDHEGNRQDEDKGEVEVDDTLIVRIALDDQAPGLHLQADGSVLKVGEKVNFTARYEPTPAQHGKKFRFQWEEYRGTANDGHALWHIIPSANAPTWSVSQSSAATKTYRATVVLGDIPTPTFVNSEDVTITWGN